jgi:hypothetical protein
VICTKPLERLNDGFFIHFHCAGDHTRGLFEAEASVVVSTAHAGQDVKGPFFIFHLGFHAGKAGFLYRDHLSSRLWIAINIHDHS